ncbi:hypothetical protein BH11ARM2_BH11ARM2_09290 [soil metagenome]
MIALAALLALQGQYLFSEFALPDADGKPSHLLINQTKEKRAGGPKISPRTFGEPPHKFEFDWVTGAYVENAQDPSYRDLRFRVYSQERKDKDDPAWNVTRMLLRLWEINRRDYTMDHNPLYNEGLVDVYLCQDGLAGGEQRFDVDDQQTPPAKVNTIYIYDLSSFSDPVEMAREVAHEYGHAMLFPVGGFLKPEEWANGYLGEKIYLRKISAKMAAGQLWPSDAMGADKDKLAAWVSKNVDSIVDPIALKGPRMDLVKTRGQASMNAYLGAALWVEEAYGPTVFARTMKLNGNADVSGYMEAVKLAVQEPDRITVNIPSRLAGKSLYLPVANAKVEGGKVLLRKDGWAKIQPSGPLTIVNR